MEKALILGGVAYSFPGGMLDRLREIPGVVDADFIYGPHDFYVVASTETKEELWDVVSKIRGTEGVTSTMTCNVVSLQPPNSSPKE
jgi:hypothetical protein